jgi:hypothetical protein
VSKSILVIDTPNSCWSCELRKSCKVIPRNQSSIKWNEIHPQCPLKNTTELLKALDYMMYYHKNINKICDLTQAYNKLKQAFDWSDEEQRYRKQKENNYKR